MCGKLKLTLSKEIPVDLRYGIRFLTAYLFCIPNNILILQITKCVTRSDPINEFNFL